MLWSITDHPFILWVVGLVSSYTLGGWIHILLVSPHRPDLQPAVAAAGPLTTPDSATLASP